MNVIACRSLERIEFLVRDQQTPPVAADCQATDVVTWNFMLCEQLQSVGINNCKHALKRTGNDQLLTVLRQAHLARLERELELSYRAQTRLRRIIVGQVNTGDGS